MSDEIRPSAGGGIGFAGLLTIVFIILKLTKHIDWSWWWVLAPIWISWGIVLVLLLIVGIIVFAVYLQKGKFW